MTYSYEEAEHWAKKNEVMPLDPKIDSKIKEKWTSSIFLLHGVTDYINLYFPQDMLLKGGDLLYSISDEAAYKLIESPENSKKNVNNIEDEGIDALVLINEDGQLITDSETEFTKISYILIFQSKNRKTKGIKKQEYKHGLSSFLEMINQLKAGDNNTFKNSLTANFLTQHIGMSTDKLSNAIVYNIFINSAGPSADAKKNVVQWLTELKASFKKPNNMILDNTSADIIDKSLVSLSDMAQKMEEKLKEQRDPKNQPKIHKSLHYLSLESEPFYSPKASAFQGFVYLSDYANFMEKKDSSNKFDEKMIKNNVRGEQSKNKSANKSMRQTLDKNYIESKDIADIRNYVDFWWLNNGVTIIASDIKQLSPNVIQLVDPQIVNGQQTSRQIFDLRGALFNKEWKIQIKLIIIPQEQKEEQERISNKIKEKIILGVNTQTPIPLQHIMGLNQNVRNLSDFIYNRSNKRILLVVRSGEENKNGIFFSYEFILQMILSAFKKIPGESRSGIGTIVKHHFKEIFTDENTENNTEVIDAWINFIQVVSSYDNYFKTDWAKEFGEPRISGDQYSYLGIFSLLNRNINMDLPLLEQLKSSKIEKETFKETLTLWHKFMQTKIVKNDFDANKYTKSKSLSIDLMHYIDEIKNDQSKENN